MDELLITISNTFGLTQTMSFIDLGVVAASAALTIITGYNFLSSPDTEEEQIEVKAVEPASKTKAELHSPTATEITWENRLFKGLSKTRADIWGKVGRLLGAAALDQDVIDELIDHDDVRAIVLKQFNYMRINGINLVQDADDLVNLYLKIAKKFPE